MYSNRSWPDRILRRLPRGFGIPDLMRYMAIGNVMVFLLDQFSGNACTRLLAFVPELVLRGEIWRIFTFVFIPPNAGGLFWFALSTYFYYFIGTALEREWGAARFTLFYAAGALFNLMVGCLTGYATMYYVNMSLFFAFSTLYPDLQFMLFFIIPVKAKWLAWLDAAFFLWDVVRCLWIGAYLYALIPVVALLNYLIFFGGALWAGVDRIRYKTSRQTIHFKQAQKKARQEKGYLHRCDVCGRTDTDHPELEFRYCSKCGGYHCYCMDHIYNHVHID